MNKAKIASKTPVNLELKQGKIFWCACGESTNQPFCDGSHKSTEIKPMMLEIKEDSSAWLCNCKQTSNPPYCDGTHKKL